MKMDKGHLNEILESILTVPTAPFHEYLVSDAIIRMLDPCDLVRIEKDDFGNLIVRYGDDGDGRCFELLRGANTRSWHVQKLPKSMLDY